MSESTAPAPPLDPTPGVSVDPPPPPEPTRADVRIRELVAAAAAEKARAEQAEARYQAVLVARAQQTPPPEPTPEYVDPIDAITADNRRLAARLDAIERERQEEATTRDANRAILAAAATHGVDAQALAKEFYAARGAGFRFDADTAALDLKNHQAAAEQAWLNRQKQAAEATRSPLNGGRTAPVSPKVPEVAPMPRMGTPEWDAWERQTGDTAWDDVANG